MTRSVSIRGRGGYIVMDDSDGIIMRSGWIDLSVYAWFTGFGAPVTDAQRWVIDTLSLELPARFAGLRSSMLLYGKRKVKKSHACMT